MKKVTISLAILLLGTVLVNAQVHFVPVEPHEEMGNLCIVETAIFDDVRLTPGDEVGVFDGNLCVGAGVIGVELPLTISTYPSVNEELPGYLTDHPIMFRIWRHEPNEEYLADADYDAYDDLNGNSFGVFSQEPFHHFDLQASATFARQWTFPANLITPFTLNMIPVNSNAAAVFATMDHLSTVYAPNGRIYMPILGINTIGNVDPLMTYRILTQLPDVLTVWGEPLFFPGEMHLPLRGNRYELISLYVEPESIDAEDVFGDIQNLTVVYQNNGHIYRPGIINSIGDVDFSQGYQLYCNANSMLNLEGVLLDEGLVITLAAGRWNWAGYPLSYQLPVESALQEIEEELEIIMNDDGRLWIPGMVNTLGFLTPGEGYYTFVDTDLTFTYNTQLPKAPLAEPITWEPPLPVEGAPEPTGLPYAVLITLTNRPSATSTFSAPSVVELFDGELLVGKAGIVNIANPIPVIAWQGSPEHNLPGFTPGDLITIKVLAADGTLLAIDKSAHFGEAPYLEITLPLQEITLPVEFRVDVAYPNPFNPTVTVPFALPSEDEVNFTVFNLLGQQVYHASRNFQAGNHHFVFNVEEMGLNLVSGIYFLQIEYQSETRVQKVMLMK